MKEISIVIFANKEVRVGDLRLLEDNLKFWSI